jgi:peptidoglycan/LPS O-acetylase OafA/YrhL
MWRSIAAIVWIFIPVAALAAAIYFALQIGFRDAEVLIKALASPQTAAYFALTVALAILLAYPTAAIISGAKAAVGPSPYRKHYRPDIDGLRALAVTAVIINHFNESWLPGGYLGVDIFFVISGFVILNSLLEDKSASLYQFLKGFYARRVKRLVPALVLFVLLCSFALSLVAPNPTYSLRTAIASLFGVSNMLLLWQTTDYFAPSTQYDAFTHTWSLGAEEQFYALFPLIVYFVAIRGGSRRQLAIILTILVFCSLAYFLFLSERAPMAAFFLMPTRFWELGIGALTCMAVRGGYAHKRLVSPIVAIGFLFVAIATPSRYGLLATLLAVVSSALLILSLSKETITYRVLTMRPVLFIGNISYSLYLWHWGILSIGRWLGVDSEWTFIPFIAVTISFAAISYFFVERPLRLNRSAGNWQVIAGGVCTCCISALVLVALRGPLQSQLTLAALSINKLAFQPPPLNQATMHCHLPLIDHPIERCLNPTRRPGNVVFVIGDSHATNYLPSLIKAAPSYHNAELRYLVEWGFVLTLEGTSDCASHIYRPCLADSFEKHLAFFRSTLEPGDVVVFSWARDRVVLSGTLPRQPDRRALRSLKDRLVELRDVVLSKGALLVLADDVPKPCNHTVYWQIIFATGHYHLCETTIAISRQDRQPLTGVYKSLLTEGVYYVDPHDMLCQGGVCGIYDPDSKSLLYSDNSPHVTKAHEMIFEKTWEDFFTRLQKRN